MNKLARTITGALLLPALLATGCAAKNANSSAETSAVKAAEAPIMMLAKKVGVNEGLVQIALQSAQSYLAGKMAPVVPGAPPSAPPSPPSMEEKATAANQGVEAAAKSLKDEGKTPFTEAQSSTLAEGLKGLL